MKLPADIKALLARRFATSHRQWLVTPEAEGEWPLRIPLGLPTEAVAQQRFDAVRAWASAWRNWQGEGTLQWSERRWRVLGTQQLPEYLLVAGPQQVAAWTGERGRWERASERYHALILRWPALAPGLGSLYDVLADYPSADFTRLVNLVAWLDANPASGLYPRQVPLAGMDTKWLEARKGVLQALVSLLRPALAESDFFDRCGFRRPPLLVRMRVLDPALRALLRGLGDITAPVEQIAALDLPATTLLVVENLQSGLALPDMPGTVAVIGLGYGVDLLGRIPWLRSLRGLYWGDIDTHGFAILHRARVHLPSLTSVLMDEATMLRFAELWSTEASQHGTQALELLTDAELAVYQALKANAWGQNLRLEQERIAWPVVCAALGIAVG